jgi:hypothetical protein
MKTLILSAFATAALITAAPAQNQTMPPGKAPVYMYEQKPLAHLPVIIDPQQAETIVDEFRTNYSMLGSPRILVYVNRDLVGESSGLKLADRSERVETTSTSSTAAVSDTNAAATNETLTTHVVANNTYQDNGRTAPSLADRQTVRDVERLVARPLRTAGASLVDQGVAAQITGDRPLGSVTLESEQARKDRDAVSRIADVVVEVLISSRTVTVAEVSGDKTYTVPDITMTAIRLKDAKVIGQASASDVISRAGGPGYVARNFGVQDVTEATALALMDDMLREGK